MSSIVLTIIGNAIFPGVGGIVGGIIGSIIDSQFLFPALFGRQTIEGPRLEDLKVTQASEGSPMAWVLGPRVRIGGTVIWQPDLIEVRTSRRVGGSSAGGGQRVNSYAYFADIAIGLTDTEGLPGPISRLVKVFGDAKVLYDADNGGDTDKYEEMVFYDGSQTVPDSLIESYEGVGNVPAHINLCYLRIKRLALLDFGNRVPNITVVLEQANDMTVGDAIKLVVKRAGYTDDEVDTSRVTSCFKGYISSGIQDVTRLVSPLTLAYGVGVQENGSTIIFRPKGTETPIVIDEDDLAAHEEGDDAPRPLTIRDIEDFDVPSEVVVRYNDVDADMQQGQQSAHRWDHPSRSQQVLDLPLTLDGVDGVVIAKRTLFSTEAERQGVQLSLPPRYAYLHEGEALRATADGVTYNIWVRQVSVGANYLVEVTGNLYQPSTYEQVAEIDEIERPAGDPYRPPEDLIPVVADLPALQNDQVERIGVYYFACAEEYEDQWQGAALYNSPTDVAANFQEVGTLPAEAVIGVTMQPITAGSTTSWDERTEIVVTVSHGGLATVTEEECIAGANRAAIKTPLGWEIIGFVNAELIATRTYRLSKLLRGLRNTERYTSEHSGSGERFVLLEQGTGNFADLTLASLGSSDYYRIVPVDGELAAHPSTRVTVEGNTHRPFAPCHVHGTWDVSGNFTLTWTRRSKYIVPPFQNAPLAPDELPETYEVEFVYGPGDGQILRTVQVDAATSLEYTAADQTADGTLYSVSVVPGQTPWHVRIYQISQTVGRGNAADVVILP
jgi:hypothetical protein